MPCATVSKLLTNRDDERGVGGLLHLGGVRCLHRMRGENRVRGGWTGSETSEKIVFVKGTSLNISLFSLTLSQLAYLGVYEH